MLWFHTCLTFGPHSVPFVLYCNCWIEAKVFHEVWCRRKHQTFHQREARLIFCAVLSLIRLSSLSISSEDAGYTFVSLSHTHTNTQTHTHKNTHAHTNTQTHTHIQTHTHANTNTHIQTHKHTHTHTCKHTHTNTHTHTHANTLSPMPIALPSRRQKISRFA